MLFFAHLCQRYCPLLAPKFRFRSISWEPFDRISPNFISAFILARSSLGLLHITFLYICIKVMALYLHQNFVSSQYLENQLIEFHQILYMNSSLQDLAWNRYTSFFAHLYQTYGPFLSQNFISAQYPENKLTEIHQILYMHSYWQELGGNYYYLFFACL